MDQAFVDWVPTHSAVWRTNGIFHHVCLRDTFVSDLGCLYEVITFDQHGQVLEANYMRLDSTLRMAFVEGVFPVKIKCIVWDRSFIAGVVHAPEEGRQALVAAVAHQKRIQ